MNMALQDTSKASREFLTDVLKLRGDDSNVSYFQEHGSTDTPTPTSPDSSRPHVTLTFAQSLDAKISGPHGTQLALSGAESMLMTHWMRTMHDAILVGIGTALNDDPQLNTRHLPSLPADSALRYHTPRPVILDSYLRLSTNCKLLKNYREGRGRRPWVICSSHPESSEKAAEFSERELALEATGARVIPVPADDGQIIIPELLKRLKSLGIRSLMVEGGARVIRSFLAAARSPAEGTTHPAVDNIIITVAPTIVGVEGVGYASDIVAAELPTLDYQKTATFGRDTVISFKVRS